MGEQGRQSWKHRADAVAGKRCDLQPALFDDRLDARRTTPPAGIGIIVHFGDIGLSAAVGAVEGAAHDERAAGIALDQQDDLTIAQ
jgi:hypothetical protein